MTLREAEKAVLEAAEKWFCGSQPDLATTHDRLVTAIRAYRSVKSAGKPKAVCWCGKTASVEGDHLRAHRKPNGESHAPLVEYHPAGGGKLL